MDVLVDTNAILAAGLDGAALKALRSYLIRTRSRLLIPSVVLEELCANRRTSIQTLERDFASAHKQLRRLCPDSTAVPPVLDANAAVSAYRDQILTVATQVHVIINQPDDITELVRRLAGHLPPASTTGEEARDVLIWLALLPMARAGRLAFVTGDKKAFLKEDDLRPELLADLGGCPGNVAVFTSIDQFLRAHHARSSFIDIEWVRTQVQTERVFQAVAAFVEENHQVLERWIEEEGELTGYALLVQIVQHEVEDFFVSDVAPNELYVSVTIWAELEVEVEYEARWRDHYFREESRAAVTKYIYPCIRMELQLAVIGEALAAAAVGSMELA